MRAAAQQQKYRRATAFLYAASAGDSSAAVALLPAIAARDTAHVTTAANSSACANTMHWDSPTDVDLFFWCTALTTYKSNVHLCAAATPRHHVYSTHVESVHMTCIWPMSCHWISEECVGIVQ